VIKEPEASHDLNKIQVPLSHVTFPLLRMQSQGAWSRAAATAPESRPDPEEAVIRLQIQGCGHTRRKPKASAKLIGRYF